MANKTIGNRQKLVIRVEPSQRALKPRNPIALPVRQRVAGSHEKTESAKRQLQNRLLKKALDGDDKD
ncbi:hypothetical protein D3870_01735 [Noviherbaspirillum cavernae]|uniref:Uncharacterized protein n=1 Tax=Noviherbaspirillum cavernae TaxID=2320862 RepID=A0A418X5L0_9BURK|nr:hypothetical protein [Noviherbaspirillum cavernae]RJG07762.1 hypothetical protein D3870_01735 [Noviherbaspirillum cavernae]